MAGPEDYSQDHPGGDGRSPRYAESKAPTTPQGMHRVRRQCHLDWRRADQKSSRPAGVKHWSNALMRFQVASTLRSAALRSKADLLDRIEIGKKEQLGAGGADGLVITTVERRRRWGAAEKNATCCTTSARSCSL